MASCHAAGIVWFIVIIGRLPIELAQRDRRIDICGDYLVAHNVGTRSLISRIVFGSHIGSPAKMRSNSPFVSLIS